VWHAQHGCVPHTTVGWHGHARVAMVGFASMSMPTTSVGMAPGMPTTSVGMAPLAHDERGHGTARSFFPARVDSAARHP